MTRDADSPYPPDFDIDAYVRESRASQGLPPKVEDVAVLRRVATLLLVGRQDDSGHSIERCP